MGYHNSALPFIKENNSVAFIGFGVGNVVSDTAKQKRKRKKGDMHQVTKFIRAGKATAQTSYYIPRI